MLRVEPEHQSIEKPPAAARTVEKEPIHWRRQPGDPKPLAERHLAARRFAVDAHDPPLPRCCVAAGADPGTVQIIEVEEIPLAYLTSPAVRIRVKAAGTLGGVPAESHSTSEAS